MKPTVYIETTVVSYLTAWPSRNVIRLSHQMLTRQWWAHAHQHFDLFVSDIVIKEASAGDPIAASERLKVLQNIPRLIANADSLQLAEKLVISLSLPQKSRLDAVHVAVAAINGMNFLVTWNCKHLANGALADKIEKTCIGFGVVAPRILTPELLMEPP